jgi:K+/H+ antiporter YhaU regulatory subunit KhtT
LPSGRVGVALDAASTQTIQISADSPVVGKTLGELHLRGKTGATVIAVVRDGVNKISPGAKYRLEEGDTVVLLGSLEKIDRAKEIFEPSEIVSGFNP